jgi:carboxylesterase 2
MQLTLAILALLSASIEGAAVNTLPTVTIASGVLIGTTSTVNTPTAGTAAVTQFFGVPFASSAPERFAPPQPPEKWDTPLTAQSRKPVCVQQFESALNSFGRLESLFNDPLYPPPEESEDCLYANIFVPPGTGPSDKKAVLFWIFGGNLAFGGGSLHFYDGSSFAYNQDVIFVTHSYRTNRG